MTLPLGSSHVQWRARPRFDRASLLILRALGLMPMMAAAHHQERLARTPVHHALPRRFTTSAVSKRYHALIGKSVPGWARRRKGSLLFYLGKQTASDAIQPTSPRD